MRFPRRRELADQFDFQVFTLGLNDEVTLTTTEHEALMAPGPQVNEGGYSAAVCCL